MGVYCHNVAIFQAGSLVSSKRHLVGAGDIYHLWIRRRQRCSTECTVAGGRPPYLEGVHQCAVPVLDLLPTGPIGSTGRGGEFRWPEVSRKGWRQATVHSVE